MAREASSLRSHRSSHDDRWNTHSRSPREFDQAIPGSLIEWNSCDTSQFCGLRTSIVWKPDLGTWIDRQRGQHKFAQALTLSDEVRQTAESSGIEREQQDIVALNFVRRSGRAAPTAQATNERWEHGDTPLLKSMARAVYHTSADACWRFAVRKVRCDRSVSRIRQACEPASIALLRILVRTGQLDRGGFAEAVALLSGGG